MPQLPPLPRYQDRPPYERVAGVVLGITAYLDQPLDWARGAARSMLDSFVQTVPKDRLTRYVTAMLGDYRTIRPHELDTLAQGLSVADQSRPRHQFQFLIADSTGAPEIGFSYREVDTERMDRTGVLKLCLPADANPAQLMGLMNELASGYPVHCAIGGYQLSYRQVQRATAFWWGYEWSRRFIGLDVQDADALAWYAHRALPTTNWLTFLGSRFCASNQVDLATAASHLEAASVTEHPGGVLFVAGGEPSLGDVNELNYPYAYREVANALRGHLIDSPCEYLGGFFEHSATKAWMQRFVDPEGWG